MTSNVVTSDPVWVRRKSSFENNTNNSFQNTSYMKKVLANAKAWTQLSTALKLWSLLLLFLTTLAILTLNWTYIILQAANLILPLATVATVQFWHALLNRKTLSAAILHCLFCASIFGEYLGWLTSCAAVSSAFYALAVMTVGLVVGLTTGQSSKSTILFLASRILVLVCIPSLGDGARAFLCYFCNVTGVIAAKYVETIFFRVTTVETKALRKRRTSNCGSFGMHFLCKTRRTSLPALGGHRPAQNMAANHQGSSATVDVALLAEAHGLVTDMLADPNLPPQVVGGLRSLAALLAPPNHVTVNHRLRPGGASVSLADFHSGSDTEEIPYTGEKPSTLSKRFRRNLPPSLLRRMSTSTWTTTTSATGLPTLEPEPSRKRSTSFRHSSEHGVTSPGGGASPMDGSSSPQSGPSVSPSRNAPSRKGRSYSTTSIPSLSRRNSRERKTVCSLHPLTPVDALHQASHELQLDVRVRGEREAEDCGLTTDEEASCRKSEDCLPPLPACLRRVNITSDYESSNESPGSSDNNDVVLGGVDDGIRVRHPHSLASVQQAGLDLSRCTLCGGRTLHGVSLDASRTPQHGEDDLTPTAQEPHELHVIEEGCGLLVDGYRYDPDSLASDPLLNRLNEWDYPIFELQEKAKELILSQMCYRVFQEVGLFEAFRIPLQEFLNYFHALEMGYRDKPYHNRMHAADVLHGVYYLTSQPIPGFTQISSEATSSPLHKSMEGTASEHGRLVHRPSFAAEVTYGVMGANFPALELMALYAAAAMHDYDHPGRTNAFLVSTYAPQAVLYNDRSVLENHHAAAAWSLLLSRPEFNWLRHLDKAEFKRFRFLVIECILATDLKRHFDILAEFNAKMNEEDAPGIDWISETDRLLAMEMCIKFADINAPCKRHDIHVRWTYRIAEEFYEQGDEEAALGLQVSPFMDRKNPQLAKLQESFINHLVAPLCNAYGEAALLPGVWMESSESEDEDGVLGTGESSDGKDTEDEMGDSDSSAPNGTRRRHGSQSLTRRKVSCLQTQHLQENYEFWVNILKQEQMEEQRLLQDELVVLQHQIHNTDLGKEEDDCKDDMETIEEEAGTSRLDPAKEAF